MRPQAVSPALLFYRGSVTVAQRSPKPREGVQFPSPVPPKQKAPRLERPEFLPPMD